MANNEKQTMAEKVKETAEGAEELAKLMANLGSGNYIGALKNAMNLLKNKQIRKILIRNVLSMIFPFIVIIIIACSLFAVFDTIKDTMINLLSNAGTSISGFIGKTWQWMTDDYWIKLDEKIEYEVEGESGETTTESYTIVDKYIKELGNQGISLESLRLLGEADYSNEEELLEDEENKELVEKYIAEFIRADIITQQPHKRRGSELVNPNNQNEIDGGVYFYRTKKELTINDNEVVDGAQENQDLEVQDKDYKQMEFMKFEDFIEKIGVTKEDFASYVKNRYNHRLK